MSGGPSKYVELPARARIEVRLYSRESVANALEHYERGQSFPYRQDAARIAFVQVKLGEGWFAEFDAPASAKRDHAGLVAAMNAPRR